MHFSVCLLCTVFNIQYHTRLKDFFQLIEDKVIGMKTSNKKTAVFLRVTTAAEKCINITKILCHFNRTFITVF